MQNISEQDRASWDAFLEAVAPLAEQHLGADYSLLMGAQFGELGEENYDDCVVGGNLPLEAACAAAKSIALVLREGVEAEIMRRGLLPDADDDAEFAAFVSCPDDATTEQCQEALNEQFGVEIAADQLERVEGGFKLSAEASALVASKVIEAHQQGDPRVIASTDEG